MRKLSTFARPIGAKDKKKRKNRLGLNKLEKAVIIGGGVVAGRKILSLSTGVGATGSSLGYRLQKAVKNRSKFTPYNMGRGVARSLDDGIMASRGLKNSKDLRLLAGLSVGAALVGANLSNPIMQKFQILENRSNALQDYQDDLERKRKKRFLIL